ncbi:hypothetical protein VFPFJ_11577 [Purpureocillium lilacinum]|uniref:Uncharacterized protein n=1 Tax=Purpureocillium lilacinum TaxID=33203 RepID=A0A179F2B3_PURLI|nr:hypothetical protein VFPFJ_11577 [Purpureocillium lilacinum]OAQ59511.1 hypothetical protein VFPFJ_11577 [Purpureocillium lilacinum]
MAFSRSLTDGLYLARESTIRSLQIPSRACHQDRGRPATIEPWRDDNLQRLPREGLPVGWLLGLGRGVPGLTCEVLLQYPGGQNSLLRPACISSLGSDHCRQSSKFRTEFKVREHPSLENCKCDAWRPCQSSVFVVQQNENCGTSRVTCDGLHGAVTRPLQHLFKVRVGQSVCHRTQSVQQSRLYLYSITISQLKVQPRGQMWRVQSQIRRY